MDATAETTNLVTQSFEVRGMTCATCAKAITETLSYFKGFKEAQFNIVDNEAIITYDPTLTQPEDWVVRLRKQGYMLQYIEPQWQNDLLDQANHVHTNLGPAKILHPVPYLLYSVLMGCFFLFMYDQIEDPEKIAFPYNTNIIFNTMGLGFMLWAFAPHYPLNTGLKRLFSGKMGMDSLIFISTFIAALYSGFSAINPAFILSWGLRPQTMMDGPVIVLASVILGRALEDSVKRRTGQALKNLIDRQPKMANWVLYDGIHPTPVEALVKGDIVLVRPGELIPIDGTVITGNSEVDQQIINGEAMPALKMPGDEVWAGTLNLNGSMQVLLMTPNHRSSIIETTIRAIRIAQSTPSKSQGMADRVAARFIPFVLVLSMAALGFWLAAGAMVQAGWFAWDLVATTAQARSLGVGSMITVLIVSCPCALGLATPIVMVKAIGTASQNGILVLKSEGIEALGNITDIIFDKTGTLTVGTPYVCEAYISSRAKRDFWALLLLASEVNNHPLTKAIMTWASLNGPDEGTLSDQSTSDFVFLNDINHPGSGMEVFMADYLRPTSPQDKEEHLKTIFSFPLTPNNSSKAQDVTPEHHFSVLIGKPSWLRSKGCLVPPSLERFSNKTNQSLKASEVWIAIEGTVLACFFLQDELRADATEIIRWAEQKHINIHLLSGDQQSAVTSLAAQLGIPAANVQAHQLPTDKSAYIQQLQAQGKIVAMIGDGINDAPSLAVADVSIAVKAGSDVAQQAASITLLRPDLRAIETAYIISRQLNTRIRQNLIWAFGYNLFMIPMAAGLSVALFHIHDSHLWAGLSMALSSITVVLNSVRIQVRQKVAKD